jgi:hypothetical protein
MRLGLTRDRLSDMLNGAVRNPGRIPPFLFVKAQQAVGKKINYGYRPQDDEWDVLIVIDACRFDLFEEVVADHEIAEKLDTVESVYSCATMTQEWVERTLDAAPDSYLEELFVVAGTGHIDAHCDTNRFGGYAPLWEYSHREKLTALPNLLTNETIRAHRQNNSDRLYAHYVQPHAPFLHCVGKYNEQEGGKTAVWRELKRGNVTKSEVWDDYAQNLRTVLDHVVTVIENVEGKIVITSDHGNLLGEYGVYGHPPYLLVPALKRVPYAVAQGERGDDYEIKDIEEFEGYERASMEDHLQNLGYKT